MRIMTFNLRCDFVLDIKNRWKYRKYLVYDIINNYNCDIIGVQEMTDKMLLDINNNIKNYNIVGTGRTKKILLERNDIFVSNKYKIEEHKTFWLSNKPDKVGSSLWYSLFPRICTTAIIDMGEEKKVRAYNTHLDCLLPQARERGLRYIGEFIEKLHKRERIPVILMGDFNATPNSKLIKNFNNGLYSNKKFIAVQEIDKSIYKKSTMNKFKGKEIGFHIDYIFVSEEIKINNVEIVKFNKNGKYPSDHYPVIADISI